MCDVDYFKGYNDFLWQPAGDEVLINLASTIEQRLRKGCDLVSRYGGEEFVIILS
jgi:diguanylate cyclase (GGDEF)-like protein